ncbi:CLUMA_CG003309, isoform A [Clunio marinus]|uniref:CLUMA_CG003309, isoform A n=1 Tax=Clunio marinus TaxID=568069 RepID=A0A1J1HSW4_9DIPT|nr:CLUMA_CG003309, isoform A [Clunio marinus]
MIEISFDDAIIQPIKMFKKALTNISDNLSHHLTPSVNESIECLQLLAQTAKDTKNRKKLVQIPDIPYQDVAILSLQQSIMLPNICLKQTLDN